MASRKSFLPVPVLILILAMLLPFSCKKGEDVNSDIPYAHINVVINPNSTLYQEISIVGGWMYYQYVDYPSRGLIIYRLTQEDFLAYERTPPQNSNACNNAETGEYSSLVVEDYYPFIYDTCSDFSYQIIDGSPVSPATVPLKRYQANYDGYNLYITN